MTVAAVILAASPASALVDAAGRASVRRIAETAWAGGAMPLVVVAADPDGAVAAALGGSEAILVSPAVSAAPADVGPAPDAGPAAQMVRGMTAAVTLVASTDAALVWPVHMAWVDAETVTMLLQAHGLEPVALLRPHWQQVPGWPVLVPVRHLDALGALAADRMPDDAIADLAATGVALRTLDLGDPGAVMDRDTPMDALPPYVGPAAPVGTPPDWGAVAADLTDEAPAASAPHLAPWNDG